MIRKLYNYFYAWQVIRERDANANLTAAGLAWLEPVEVILLPFSVLSFALLLGAGGAASHARTPILAVIALVIAAILCIAICFLLGSTSRGIAFTREGRISIRGGWVNRLEMMWSLKEHADIASIETIKTNRGHAVVIFTTWGDTHLMSDGLDEAEARLVAVQLTIALRQIREAISNIQAFQQNTVHALAGWID